MRHPSTIPIEVIEGDSNQTTHLIHNVSLGGLAFNAEKPIELGTVIEVRITFVRPSFSAKARVMWCKAVEAHFELGVEFLEAGDVFRARMVEQVCHIEQHRQDVLKTQGRTLTSQEAALEWIAIYAASFPD